MKKHELLAPVGSPEALRAAVQNGADAVYLGGKLFNARQYASNFSLEELKEAVEYCHLRDVRVLVTVNILIDDSEMKDALDYIKYLNDIDVDGVIVQDIGLASMIRELFPDLALHGSTQMTIHNAEGAKFLHDLGFKRVVLSRETPIEEIEYIKERVPIEIEVFIHGALCVSYSGQCLMSSMIGGRSGNRGKCAQPCRMPSSIVNGKGEVLGELEDKYLLSPKDLRTIHEIDRLKDLGIDSFKIEGRMKRPEYVGTVVRIYRKAMDMGVDSITEQDRQDMTQIFNRDWTRGLTFGDFGEDFISLDRPDNRGVRLGKVIEVKNDSVTLLLEEDIEKGDGIEISIGGGKYRGLVAPYPGSKGKRYKIVKKGYLEKDSVAYKTSSLDLLERAQLSYEDENVLRKINMKAEIKLGEQPRLEIRCGDKFVEVIGEDRVEESKNRPLSEERVLEQLEKLGGTAYELEDISIDMEDGLFLPVSALNKLRRDGIAELDSLISNFNKRTIEDDGSYGNRRSELLKLEARGEVVREKLSVKLQRSQRLQDLDLDKLDRVYLPMDDLDDLREAIGILKPKNIEIYLWTPKILYRKGIEELKWILDAVEKDIDGVAVSNLGSFAYIKDRYDLKIHGDISMNIFNSYSLRFLKELGMDSSELSIELNMGQILNIASTAAMDVGVMTYGYIPVMTMEHCPMSLLKGCSDGSQCDNCSYSDGYSLRDRINAEFRISRKNGLTTLYNSVPLMILDNLDRLKDVGLAELGMSFNWEEDIREIQSIYYDFINDKVDYDEMMDFINDYKEFNEITNGHYFRGIMD